MMIDDAAVSPPQFSESYDTKLKIATGSVRVELPAMISEKMKLFQDAMMPRMPVATMPGRASGSATRRKTPVSRQPSISAASSSSRGTSSKKPTSTQITSGSTTTMCVSITAG